MLNVKLTVAALVAVLVAGLLAVPNAGAQSSGRQCIPEAGRPAVSAVRGTTGDIGAGTSPVGFTVQVRHHGNTVSAVTVSVTVNRDGVTSSQTVVVPTVSNPQRLSNRDFVTRATLSVSRTSTTQTVAITVNENANYYVCKVHAGVSITGVHQRVPPPEPQVWPEPDTPPPASTSTVSGPVSELSQAEQDWIDETVDERPPRPDPPANPTNPDGTTNLYGPGGFLTPEHKLQWQCWAAAGNTEILREHGIISQSQSCD